MEAEESGVQVKLLRPKSETLWPKVETKIVKFASKEAKTGILFFADDSAS